MRISLHAPDSKNNLAERARDLVESALCRYGDSIREVVVRIRDQNGPRGGRDQRCVLRVALLGAPEVVVREQRDRPLEALGSALKRARRSIGERINARGRRNAPKANRTVREKKSYDGVGDRDG